ncbi:DUF58 domain-containing protein [Quadrisphaera sp. INWT6]|uniref:DUF58 domain-containing protein n=1 Tax=Quadrisphaera sp. INWT6 TaxID=2596917 RepID=UPI00189283CB|nr:DUF58 domain-containing protein [Quadrisphaera sp. INWT6]MBF5080824.1 DUF58 domain-containing protein [Quadrisphaera sp. INWT6]
MGRGRGAPGRRGRDGARLARRARGLTPRGRALVVVGVLLGAAGLWQGQEPLLRVAVLVLALPLVALAVAALTGARTAVRRSTSPRRAVVGQTCRVRLDLRNPGRLGTPVLLAQDRLPAGWPRAPRFAVDPLPPGGRAAVAYTATPPRRGRHRLGPLQVLVTDPLGLCELPARTGGQDDVLVLPAVEHVPGAAALLGDRGEGEASGSGTAGGEQGMGTREYRPGDDVRRVHWRSTARRGELMVRQDEQPHQRRGVVVLDRRPGAWSDDDGFERAVTAAASLAVSLHDAGAAVRLELGGERSPAGPLGREPVLEALAVVTTAGAPGQDAAADRAAAAAVTGSGSGAAAAEPQRVVAGGPDVLVSAVGAAVTGGSGESGAGPGLLAVVAGRLTRADADGLVGVTRPRAGRRRSAALVVLAEPAGTGAVEVLVGAGWSVLDLSEGEPLADAWRRAADRSDRSGGADRVAAGAR